VTQVQLHVRLHDTWWRRRRRWSEIFTDVELRTMIVIVSDVNGHCGEGSQRRLSDVERGHRQTVNLLQFPVQRPTVQVSSQSVDEEVVGRAS